MEDVFKKIETAIYACNKAEAERLTRDAISSGIEPLRIIEEGMKPGIQKVGDDFENEILFLPELVGAGETAVVVTDIVEEALTGSSNVPVKGTFAIGTVKGDIHSIGKNLASTMMKVSGFKVTDLGVDVSPEEFMEAAESADAIGLSGLLTLSLRFMEETAKQIAAKFPEKVIIIGGAATDPALADTFGVFYGPDAASAPKIVEKHMKK